MLKSLDITEFLRLSAQWPIIDVRSPGEFGKGHIPGATNVALFSDEERAIVGTVYKREGREKAIDIGYDFVKPKLEAFLEKTDSIRRRNDELPGNVLVHCWRGGMRSKSFANLLIDHGIPAFTLENGYKAYRHYVLDSFEHLPEIVLLGGETGSGKTEILHAIAELGRPILDLERLARHKGSAFGSLGEESQPTQEQFENNLSKELERVRGLHEYVWLEDESRTIGKCRLPDPLWFHMKASPILRILVSKKERVERLIRDYGQFSKDELGEKIQIIKKRLGPQHAKRAMEELQEGRLEKVVDIALTYYDKAYNYCHEKRNYQDVHFVDFKGNNSEEYARAVIQFADALNQEHV